MIANAVIGLGLPWPESARAISEYCAGSYAAMEELTGINRKTMRDYLVRGSSPTNYATRQRFIRYGWTTHELPPGCDTPPNINTTYLDARTSGRNDLERAEISARVKLYSAQVAAQVKAGVPRHHVRLDYCLPEKRLT